MYTMTKQDNQDKIFNAILTSGILIGSRAWGGFKQNSDWDIILSEENYDKVKIYCKNNNIHFTHYFGGSDNITGHTMFNITNDKLHFEDGRIINILTYEKEDLGKIKELNRIVEALNSGPVGKQMQEDKQVRIRIVETMLEILFCEKIRNKSCWCQELPDEDIPF